MAWIQQPCLWVSLASRSLCVCLLAVYTVLLIILEQSVCYLFTLEMIHWYMLEKNKIPFIIWAHKEPIGKNKKTKKRQAKFLSTAWMCHNWLCRSTFYIPFVSQLQSIILKPIFRKFNISIFSIFHFCVTLLRLGFPWIEHFYFFLFILFGYMFHVPESAFRNSLNCRS